MILCLLLTYTCIIFKWRLAHSLVFIFVLICLWCRMLIYLSGILLFCALFALSVIDIRSFTLPNILTLPLILLGLGFGMYQNNLTNSLLGSLIGYGGFVGLDILYKQVRSIDGLGRGDAKLLAAGGAWCGWYGLPFIILIASGSGLIHALFLSSKTDKEPTHIPFGPHLAVGIFLVWTALFLLS